MAASAITPPPGYQLEAPPAAAPAAGATPPPGYTLETQQSQPATTPLPPSLSNRTNQYRAVPDAEDAAKDAAFRENHPIVHAMVHGLGQASGDVLDAVNPVNIAKGAWDQFPPVAAYKSIQNAVPAIKAFHAARVAGKSVGESLTVANEVANQHNAASQMLNERAAEFKKDPGAQTVRALGDVAALVASFYAGGPEAGGAETEAATAETEGAAIPKPGIVKQVWQGKNVAEAPAQAAIREAVGGNEASLQRVLEKPIVEARAAKNAAYAKIGEAQESAKPQVARLEAIDKELDGIDETLQPERAGSLEDERAAITKQLGETGGADPQLLKQANEANKTYKGMQLMEKRILKNPRIVEGDITHGTPETVNVDRAIVELKKMETTRWGNQVEQAFGPEGASQLLDKLYAAQRAGAHAVKVRQFLKWAAIGLGASTGAVKGVEMMMQ